MTDRLCPCSSGKSLSECCGVFLDGDQLAPTAEQLMRSRYSAYVLGHIDYLLNTWSGQTRPASIELDNVQWLGLKIKRKDKGGVNDSEGVVEFVARYKLNGRGYRLHEVSRFTRQDGTWYYLDGKHMS